jgi:lysophospholipase L1-like esterase
LKQAIRVVAFGDSITSASQQPPADRWPELLRCALQERFTASSIAMFNAGVGGNTSREGLRRIDQDVHRHGPHFVLVEFGNDGTLEEDRHVGCDEFVGNLGTIKTQVAARSAGRLVVATFPPIVDEWHAYGRHDFYRSVGGLDAYQEIYRDLTRRFARSHNVPLADVDTALRKQMADAGPAKYILPDGVHLTADGNRVVAQVMLEVLSAEIAEHLAAET